MGGALVSFTACSAFSGAQLIAADLNGAPMQRRQSPFQIRENERVAGVEEYCLQARAHQAMINRSSRKVCVANERRAASAPL
jgi:hypothetical protein